MAGGSWLADCFGGREGYVEEREEEEEEEEGHVALKDAVSVGIDLIMGI